MRTALRSRLPGLDALAQRRYPISRWRAARRRHAPRSGLQVSVIVPIFNALPYLRECMDSLLAQDIGPGHFEVICADDGSDDGSLGYVEELAQSHPGLTVIRLPHSGWPGAARNAGLSASRGKYVFFADADDVLRTDALRRLVDYAERLGSDVVSPRVGSLGGRRTGHPFVYSRRTAPVALAMRSFTAHKLIRRALLAEHHIAFPEGIVRLEDGIFITQCYLLAHRLSVLADDEYYFLRRRTDRRNISSRPAVPDQYVASVAEMAQIIRGHASSRRLASALVTDLFRRKCLSLYPATFLRAKPARQAAWVQAHHSFLEEHLTRPSERRLSAHQRDLVGLIRAGDTDAVRRFCLQA